MSSNASQSHLRVAGAQLWNVVGDLEGNAEAILDAMRWAEEHDADVVVFPELALTGYGIGDLAQRGDFLRRSREVLDELAAASGRTTAVVGTVVRVPPRRSWDTRERSVSIAAAVLCDGELRGVYHKVLLPNYDIFEDARNFAAGEEPAKLWGLGQTVAGIAICEDLWSGDGPPERQAAGGARIVLAPNGSPFHYEKPTGRLALARQVARRNAVPVVYVNCVGGQDELVFDGGSLVVDSNGELLYRAPQFTTERFVLDVPLGPRRETLEAVTTVHGRPVPRREALPAPRPAAQLTGDAQIWETIVVGTREFVKRSGALGAGLALSGGISAAVTAAAAADALGPENVLGIAMPTSDTPGEELEDARALTDAIGVRFAEVPLRAAAGVLGDELMAALDRPIADSATASLVRRTRAAVLWAACEELGYLPLATANKTDLSIGSVSVQGDLAGAFAPLKDCRKMMLHRLAALRNERNPAIPDRTLERTPETVDLGAAGEHRYEDVDAIVERYVEQGATLEDLTGAGFADDLARAVLQLVDDAEFVRRDAPPGVRISERAFGQDLRMPILSEWRPFRSDVGRSVGGAFTLGRERTHR